MQIALVIWSAGKKQALKVFSSHLSFIAYCWNFVFISSCWMTKPDDGRDGKPAFTQPRPAQPREQTEQTSGRILSWWIGCFCLFATLWFRVFWASASVIEFAAVPTLRWLLTFGLISLIFLIFFTAVLSGLSLARRAPAESWSTTLIHTLSHWSTLFSCTPVVSTLHHFSLHGRVGTLWSTPIGSPHAVRWAPSPAVGPPLSGLAFGGTLGSLRLFPALTNLVFLLVIAGRNPATWRASIMVTVCCIFTALRWNSTSACNICCLRVLVSFNDIKLHRLSISYAAKVLPGVLLLYGSLVYKYIFLGVMPVDEALPVSYTEPFYCSQNLRCDDLLVPAGRRCQCEAARAAAPCAAAARRAGRGVGSRSRVSASLLLVAATVTGAPCGSCGSSRAVMVTRPVAAVALLGVLWGLLSQHAILSISLNFTLGSPTLNKTGGGGKYWRFHG